MVRTYIQADGFPEWAPRRTLRRPDSPRGGGPRYVWPPGNVGMR